MKQMQRTDYKAINGDEWKIVYRWDEDIIWNNKLIYDYYKKRKNKKWYQKTWEWIGDRNPFWERDVIHRLDELSTKSILDWYKEQEKKKSYENQLKEFFHQED